MESRSHTPGLEKKRTTLLGIAFIMATVTAIIGMKLYDPILLAEDPLRSGAANMNKVVSGAFFEMLLACSNSFTAILMYPYLKKFSQRLGVAYVCFRLLEVVLILIGVVSVLALLSLSGSYVQQPQATVGTYLVVGGALKAIHDWTFILGPHFMLGLNTFIYSYVFYRSGLVPRKLSLWGISGAIMVFIAAILQMFDIANTTGIAVIILALPVAFYEMVLAGWLIANGFNAKALTNKTSADL